MSSTKSPSKLLRDLALRHSRVEETRACKGTAVESSAFKVGNRTFLFARDVQMMVKLDKSLPEARELASKGNGRYQAGTGGWVTVKFVEGEMPPQSVLGRWIGESYRLMAAEAAPAKRKKSPKRGKA